MMKIERASRSERPRTARRVAAEVVAFVIVPIAVGVTVGAMGNSFAKGLTACVLVGLIGLVACWWCCRDGSWFE